MSVPVAGTVQVYSSNGSAHFFTTSVTVTKANEFQNLKLPCFLNYTLAAQPNRLLSFTVHMALVEFQQFKIADRSR